MYWKKAFSVRGVKGATSPRQHWLWPGLALWLCGFLGGCAACGETEPFCDVASCAAGTVCGSSGECIPAACAGELIFPDVSLERALRATVGTSVGTPLLYENVRQVTDLDTSVDSTRGDPGIVDLSGVQCLTGLRRLSMRNNDISDLSPLRDLPALEELSLVSTPVTDLSPLTALATLEVLDLGYARDTVAARDLGPLSSIPSLRQLDLSHGGVTEVEPLSRLTWLEELDLDGNDIVDVSALTGLVQLRHLGLEGNQVNDVSPLARLTGLETLELGHNRVVDIGPLGENVGLGVGDFVALSDNPLDCREAAQGAHIRSLLDRSVELVVDCLSCLDDPSGLDCVCWADPDFRECYCHENPLECLCAAEPGHPDCFCYFYPGDPACTE